MRPAQNRANYEIKYLGHEHLHTLYWHYCLICRGRGQSPRAKMIRPDGGILTPHCLADLAFQVATIYVQGTGVLRYEYL